MAAPKAAASRNARAQANPDVIVVGAGLSGLYAAFLLEEQGAKVLVLEGKRRVGCTLAAELHAGAERCR